jgi:hypothetical protein
MLKHSEKKRNKYRTEAAQIVVKLLGADLLMRVLGFDHAWTINKWCYEGRGIPCKWMLVIKELLSKSVEGYEIEYVHLLGGERLPKKLINKYVTKKEKP